MEKGPAWCEVANDDERQSATARRKGSGTFLCDEDLNLETAPTPINCILELPGLRPGLKVVEEDMDGSTTESPAVIVSEEAH